MCAVSGLVIFYQSHRCCHSVASNLAVSDYLSPLHCHLIWLRWLLILPLLSLFAGNVLGIELDRADKVESVKKKIQAAFGVPTEHSALVFGDLILDKDLSEIRSDAPLLLTKGIYRSSSTPCLSPTSRDITQNKVFEIVGGSNCCSTIKRLVRESAKAIEAGVEPVPAGGGLGGAYYFRNCRGDSIAIVKPTDEEPFAPNNPKGFTGRSLGQPGLKRSIRVGETGLREVAAYLLDHEHFAKVPSTALVKAIHPIFNVNLDYSGLIGNSQPGIAKIASFQQFVRHDFDASEHGTSRFPVSCVHRIGILDIRLFNTDRHAGNILVKKLDVGARGEGPVGDRGSWSSSGLRVEEAVELIPIDHGLCLPETLDDPYFEWLHWPQASFPFTEEELAYIERLDPARDIDMLRKQLPTLREACLRMLVLSTTFLKQAAASGLSLAEIGGMMSRELCGVDEGASELETVCMQAKMAVEEELLASSSEGESLSLLDCSLSDELTGEEFQFDMEDHDEVAPLDRLESNGRILQSPVNGYPPLSLLSRTPLTSSFRDGLRPQLILQDLHPSETTSVPLSPLGAPHRYDSISPLDGDESVALARMSGPARSTSLNFRKFRCHTQMDQRRPLGLRGIAALNVVQNVPESPDLPNTNSGPLVLTDMDEKAWALFLGYFQELLAEAFAKVKFKSKNQVQRLGTSCQF